MKSRNRRSLQMWRQIALSSQNRPKETSHFLANPSVNCSILDFQSFLFPSSSSFFLSLPASFWSAVLLTTALFLCLEGSSNEAKRSHCHGFLVINITWKDKRMDRPLLTRMDTRVRASIHLCRLERQSIKEDDASAWYDRTKRAVAPRKSKSYRDSW